MSQVKVLIPNSFFARFRGFWRRQSCLTSEMDIDLPSQTVAPAAFTGIAQERVNLWFEEGSNFIGTPDFLPMHILLKGHERGKAVCCIFKAFENKDDPVLAAIIERAKQISENNEIKDELYIRLKDGSLFKSKEIADDPETFKSAVQGKEIPIATGFWVGQNYLLTSLHVIKSLTDLSDSNPSEQLSTLKAVFNYEISNTGEEFGIPEELVLKFDENFFKPAKKRELDYVLLKFKADNVLKNFASSIPLKSTQSVTVIPRQSNGSELLERLIRPDRCTYGEWQKLMSLGIVFDVVNIIQHPEGRPKEIVIFNNELTELYNDFLVYKADASAGSSGGLLCNATWEPIGMHQAAIIERSDDSSQSFSIVGYLGTRLTSILADLEAQKDEDLEIQEFLKSLEPQDTPSSPPSKVVFISAGRDRTNVLGKQNAALEQAAMIKLREQVAEALGDLNIKAEIVEGENSTAKASLSLQEAIGYINQKSQGNEDLQQLAIELLVDSNPQATNANGISIYYDISILTNNMEASQQLRESLERDLLGDDPNQFRIRPNTYASRTPFLNQTHIPALVFYIGFLSNSKDVQKIEALKTSGNMTLAKGIARGIAVWFDSHSKVYKKK